MAIVTKLSESLSLVLNTADELWIAVGLMNLQGLDFIFKHAPSSCNMNILLGIDLPTEPRVFKRLHELQLRTTLNVRLYSDKEYYHPKIYLVKKDGGLSGFVGSANCTNGGLYNNVELCVRIQNREDCSKLRDWFNSLYILATPLTNDFIKKYSEDFAERKRRRNEERKAAKKDKYLLNQKYEASMKERESLINQLNQYRSDQNYENIVHERATAISELKSSLDYPRFKEIDVDGFFSIWDLGHLLAFPKPTIKNQLSRFSNLLRFLCNEKIDIVERYEEALHGKYKINGINEGLISKILTIHDPMKYCVINSKSRQALKRYGIGLPRGLSTGEKYKITCRFLADICREVKIKNLAILDYYLYLEGQE